MNAETNNIDSKLSPLKIIFYIATGAKDVYYTLNKIVQDGAVVVSHNYVQNLSMEEDEAIAKAELFAERLCKAGLDCVFDSTVDGETYGKLGSNLSVEDHFKMEKVKQGVMPFGMHRNKPFKDIPQDYMLWAISKYQSSTNAVENSLAFAILAAAIDNNYLKDGDDILECLTDFNIKNSKSEYIGEQGQRLDLECLIVSSSSYYDELYRQEVHSFLLKQDENMISYSGTIDLGSKGGMIKLKATIKKTYESKGIKYTQITRPKLLSKV
jgi:hypothetical protein